jgi:hypothetical protein
VCKTVAHGLVGIRPPALPEGEVGEVGVVDPEAAVLGRFVGADIARGAHDVVAVLE